MKKLKVLVLLFFVSSILMANYSTTNKMPSPNWKVYKNLDGSYITLDDGSHMIKYYEEQENGNYKLIWSGGSFH